MERLTATDASFLYLESPQTPMHVGSLHVIELAPELLNNTDGSDWGSKRYHQQVQAHIKQRMHLAPIFSRKLAMMPFEIAAPMWVKVDSVDFDFHIRHVTLPSPGSFAQLEQLIATLHSRLMDRNYPLWEFYIIGGLDATDSSAEHHNHVALYSKIHHAGLDGQGGVALANAMLDVSPIPRKVAAPTSAPNTKPASKKQPSVTQMIWSGASDIAGQYASLVRTLPSLIRSASSASSTLSQSFSGNFSAAGVGQAIGKSIASGLGIKPGKKPDEPLGNSLDDEPVPYSMSASNSLNPLDGFLVGPKTHFNVSIGSDRTFASLSVPLAHVKAVGTALDATLNDVVLEMCSAALRRYLADFNNTPDKPLIAAVPVSLREAGNTDANNQALILPVSLASHLSDPIARLKAIKESSAKMKIMLGAIKQGKNKGVEIPTLGMPWLVSSLNALYARTKLADRIPPIANLIISNVPGPQIPLYLAGGLVKTFYPLSIPVHGLGMNITLQSYNGRLDFGVTAARSAVPDAKVILTYISHALDVLLELVEDLPETQSKTAQVHEQPKTKRDAKATPKKIAIKKTAKKVIAKKTAVKKVAPKVKTKIIAAVKPTKPVAKKPALKMTTKVTKKVAKRVAQPLTKSAAKKPITKKAIVKKIATKKVIAKKIIVKKAVAKKTAKKTTTKR